MSNQKGFLVLISLLLSVTSYATEYKVVAEFPDSKIFSQLKEHKEYLIKKLKSEKGGSENYFFQMEELINQLKELRLTLSSSNLENQKKGALKNLSEQREILIKKISLEEEILENIYNLTYVDRFKSKAEDNYALGLSLIIFYKKELLEYSRLKKLILLFTHGRYIIK